MTLRPFFTVYIRSDNPPFEDCLFAARRFPPNDKDCIRRARDLKEETSVNGAGYNVLNEPQLVVSMRILWAEQERWGLWAAGWQLRLELGTVAGTWGWLRRAAPWHFGQCRLRHEL